MGLPGCAGLRECMSLRGIRAGQVFRLGSQQIVEAAPLAYSICEGWWMTSLRPGEDGRQSC
jgi:hypothetical protein